MDGSEHPGQPQRPPASAHLMIDSLDRYGAQFGGIPGGAIGIGINNGLPAGNDFTISAQGAMLNGYFTRLAITQVLLKYNVPTVVTGVNDTLRVSEVAAGASVTITIPQGFYTPTTIAAAITAQFAAAAAPYNTYTCVWNEASKSLKFASNDGQSFAFVTPAPASNTNPGSNVLLRTYYLLGINSPIYQAPIGTPAAIQICGPPRLYYTSFVDIVSERLTKYQRVKDSESESARGRKNYVVPGINNIVARVYLVAPNTRIETSADTAVGGSPIDICIDYNTPKHMKWSPGESIYQMDFRLFDQFGLPLYWTQANPTEFLLTCLASET